MGGRRWYVAGLAASLLAGVIVVSSAAPAGAEVGFIRATCATSFGARAIDISYESSSTPELVAPGDSAAVTLGVDLPQGLEAFATGVRSVEVT